MKAEDLYGLPLDQFVPQRTSLARALRAEGRREEADRATRLRKPSVAAWAVNQLVRTQKRQLAELLRAGDELRDAQAAVLSGSGDRRTLRGAMERERAAVDALIATARGLLTSEGHELSATTIDRVADTLHAAALDSDARAQVRDGCLDRELRHVGIGAAPARAPGAARESGGSRVPEAARKGGAGRERASATAAARAAESEARRRLERASRAVETAQRRRERAQRAVLEAERTLAAADQAIAAARAEEEDAAAAHRRARRELDSP